MIDLDGAEPQHSYTLVLLTHELIQASVHNALCCLQPPQEAAANQQQANEGRDRKERGSGVGNRFNLLSINTIYTNVSFNNRSDP